MARAGTRGWLTSTGTRRPLKSFRAIVDGDQGAPVALILVVPSYVGDALVTFTDGEGLILSTTQIPKRTTACRRRSDGTPSSSFDNFG
jgi:hypothetical protein